MCGRKARRAHLPWFWFDQYDLKLQIVGLSDVFNEIIVRGSTNEPGFSVWHLCEREVLCMETVNNPLAFMQKGRYFSGLQISVTPILWLRAVYLIHHK